MNDRELKRLLNRLRDWQRVAHDPREQFHDIAPEIVHELEQLIREEWPDALDVLARLNHAEHVEAERDALIRDCWEACGGKGPDSSDDELVGTISTMRVGLERWQKRACDAEAERDALQARIAQLEQSALTGYEDGWHALRNERDALRARIEGALSAVPKGGAWDVAPNHAFLSVMLPSHYAGKRVALVVLGDDE